MINQDEGVTPTDIEREFTQAGLLDLVYRGPLGPFPTLRDMIDSNQRLVVMAENDAGDVPWYHLAYEHALQETPFRFTNAAQLTDPARLPASCRPNRGPSTAPLFLLNHWVDTTPTPASVAGDDRQRRAGAARPGPEVRADPGPSPEPRRGRLLSPGRCFRRGQHPERRRPLTALGAGGHGRRPLREYMLSERCG